MDAKSMGAVGVDESDGQRQAVRVASRWTLGTGEEEGGRHHRLARPAEAATWRRTRREGGARRVVRPARRSGLLRTREDRYKVHT